MTKASSWQSNWVPILTILVLFLLTGCSKSITSIGPFEGYWSGELGYNISSGYESGMIQFEVKSDRSLKGYGELWDSWEYPSVKAFEIEISGQVNPNGSLECRYKINWTHPTRDFLEHAPQGFGDWFNGTIDGFLNPAWNYGLGYCLTGEAEKVWLFWLVHRQE